MKCKTKNTLHKSLQKKRFDKIIEQIGQKSDMMAGQLKAKLDEAIALAKALCIMFLLFLLVPPVEERMLVVVEQELSRILHASNIAQILQVL